MHKYGDVELDTDGSDLIPEEPEEETEDIDSAEDTAADGIQDDPDRFSGEDEFDKDDFDEGISEDEGFYEDEDEDDDPEDVGFDGEETEDHSGDGAFDS